MRFFCIIVGIFLFSSMETAQSLRNFKIIQENVKVNITAPDIISDAKIYIRKVNRTFDGLNSTATFKIQLNDSVFVSAQSFEYKGNHYQPSVMDTKLDFCKYLKDPTRTNLILALFYPTIVQNGNFPRKCPIPAGTYYMNNFNINAETFPPYFPTDTRWRFVISVYHKERSLFITTVSFRVEPKPFWM